MYISTLNKYLVPVSLHINLLYSEINLTMIENSSEIKMQIGFHEKCTYYRKIDMGDHMDKLKTFMVIPMI